MERGQSRRDDPAIRGEETVNWGRAAGGAFALAAAALLRAENLWVPIAADPHRRILEGIAMAPAPGPEQVRLIGSRPPMAPRENPQVWLVAGDDWAPSPAERAKPEAAAAPPEPELPPDAVRLESSERVYGESALAGSGRPEPLLRNPWEIRWALRPKAVHTALACQGILFGGEGGAVAWVNGRAVRRDDRVGPFRIDGIRRNEVLLELRGVRYVLARGRRATIAWLAP
jgi:hypothetical protein